MSPNRSVHASADDCLLLDVVSWLKLTVSTGSLATNKQCSKIGGLGWHPSMANWFHWSPEKSMIKSLNQKKQVVLTHRAPCECLLSSPHLQQSVCRILFPGQILQMKALSPGKTKQRRKKNNYACSLQRRLRDAEETNTIFVVSYL